MHCKGWFLQGTDGGVRLQSYNTLLGISSRAHEYSDQLHAPSTMLLHYRIQPDTRGSGVGNYILIGEGYDKYR